MDSYIQKVEKVTKNQEMIFNESLENKISNQNQQAFNDYLHLMNVNGNNTLMDVGKMQQKRLEENVDSMVPPIMLNQNRSKEYKSQGFQTLHNDMETKTRQLQESTFKQRNERGETVVDSDSMVAVKNALSALNGYWDNDATSALNENFENTYKGFSKKYDEVINAAQHYISKHKCCFTPKGRQRRDWVKDIKKQCEYEKTRLRQAMTDVYTEFCTNRLENKENQKLTYGDILRYIRSDIVVTKKRGLSGGNNSDVFVIEGHDDKVFKKNEYLSENFDFVKKRILNGVSKFENHEYGNKLISFTKEYIDFVQKCIDESKDIGDLINNYKYRIGEDLIGIFSAKSISSFENRIKYIADALGSLFKATKNKQAEGGNKPKISEEEVKAKKLQYGFELTEIYDKYLPDSETTKHNMRQRISWDSLISNNSECMNSIAVAKVNKIHMETRLTTRNIATCRIAKMLNMENLVIKCENVVVKEGEKSIEAIQMEKAKGKRLADLRNYCRKKGMKMKITPKIANDINRLQLLDLICGQADRHGANIFLDYKIIDGEVYITEIKGIDNDMSFGNLREDDLKNGYNRMAWLYDLKNRATFKKIDKSTYDEIMALRDKYDSVVYSLADTDLDQNEFEALKRRIDLICNYLEEQKNSNSDFIIANNELEAVEIKCNNEKYLNKNNWYQMGDHDNNTCIAQIFFESCKVEIANIL